MIEILTSVLFLCFQSRNRKKDLLLLLIQITRKFIATCLSIWYADKYWLAKYIGLDFTSTNVLWAKKNDSIKNVSSNLHAHVVSCIDLVIQTCSGREKTEYSSYRSLSLSVLIVLHPLSTIVIESNRSIEEEALGMIMHSSFNGLLLLVFLY